MAKLLDAMVCMLNTCLSAVRPIEMSLSEEQSVPEDSHALGKCTSGGPVMVLRILSNGEARWTGHWIHG